MLQEVDSFLRADSGNFVSRVYLDARFLCPTCSRTAVQHLVTVTPSCMWMVICECNVSYLDWQRPL